MKISKKVIYKACEILENKDSIWTCWAIYMAKHKKNDIIYYQWDADRDVIKYANFYKKSLEKRWKLKKEDVHTRIMLLLNYLECGGSL